MEEAICNRHEAIPIRWEMYEKLRVSRVISLYSLPRFGRTSERLEPALRKWHLPRRHSCFFPGVVSQSGATSQVL